MIRFANTTSLEMTVTASLAVLCTLAKHIIDIIMFDNDFTCNHKPSKEEGGIGDSQ